MIFTLFSHFLYLYFLNSTKGATMKSPISNLGILLLIILLGISLGSLLLIFTSESGNLYGIAMGIILVVIVLTFISYLLYDLYNSLQEEQTQERSYKTLK